jgi:hypothetical protein
MTDIDYNISTYPSKYHGYWKPTGKINLYVSTMWKEMDDGFKDLDADKQIDEFMNHLSNITLIETICFYRGKEKIKMKNKCKPHCKVARLANYLVFPDDWADIKKFYVRMEKSEKNVQ